MVSNKFGRKPQMLQTDDGGEFVSHHTQTFLAEEGIPPRKSGSFTPAERKPRSLLEMSKCMQEPVQLKEDNQSCIKISQSGKKKMTARTKHIGVKFHLGCGQTSSLHRCHCSIVADLKNMIRE
ncbi:UNVERIFIED_CONTAM: hypothetical protein K2H54_042901 [Gekko kuhli]